LADEVARRFVALANQDGAFPGPWGIEVLRNTLHEDANQFLSLDPQKILDEWERMQQVANKVGVDVSEDVTIELNATAAHLSDWHGRAAEEFKARVSSFEAFSGLMHLTVLETVKALAAMLRVAVQAREDFAALASATADTVTKAIEKADDKRTEFSLKVGNGVAKTILNMFTDPKGWATAAAENAMDIAVEGTIYAMNGSDIGEIVDNYMRERDRLLRSYEVELDEVADIIGKAQGYFLGQNPKLFLPLPSYTRVESPDFRYENFMSKDMGTAVFGPKVDEERKNQAADKQPNRVMDPASPVQRLNGFTE
jgi:hypothetical protein